MTATIDEKFILFASTASSIMMVGHLITSINLISMYLKTFYVLFFLQIVFKNSWKNGKGFAATAQLTYEEMANWY